MSSTASPEERPKRLLSLDAFRGMTIAAMILVNNPGSWSHQYAPLKHARWHGWTFTDLVFPFFLFIVGVAITISLGRRLDQGCDKGPLARKALKRSVIIFLLGMLLAGFPTFDLSTIRIPGVLQRIALCYLLGSLLYLYAPRRWLPRICVALLFGYWALMVLVPVPGHGAGMLDSKDGNLAAWIDRLLLEGHLWRSAKTWDPEGLLSTIPALCTLLFGIFAGTVLASTRSDESKCLRLLTLGCTWMIAGWIWGWFFPINKQIWTSSYAVLMAGFATIGLGLCYEWFDRQKHPRLGRFFAIYGVNAILVFVGSGLLGRTMNIIQWETTEGTVISLKTWMYTTILTPVFPPYFASFLWALLWISGWFVFLWLLWRKNIILKV